MIIGFELSQVIEYPAEKTFLFLSDFANMSLWNYYIQSVVKVTEGPITTGTIFRQKRPHDLLHYKMAAVIYPHTILAEVQPPGPQLSLRFDIQKKNNGSEVTYNWKLDLNNYRVLKYLPRGKLKDWLLSFADKVIQKKTRPAVLQNFKKLKTLLEEGEVTLQNDRVVALKENLS